LEMKVVGRYDEDKIRKRGGKNIQKKIKKEGKGMKRHEKA